MTIDDPHIRRSNCILDKNGTLKRQKRKNRTHEGAYRFSHLSPQDCVFFMTIFVEQENGTMPTLQNVLSEIFLDDELEYF